MSVPSSIIKSKFKKWLKASAKVGPVYYKSGKFIGTQEVQIRLDLIDNLDDIKPAIVEVFGHLEGDWLHSEDGLVYEYDPDSLEFECMEADVYNINDNIDDEDCEDYGIDEIQDSGFRRKNGAYVYDNLTLVPDVLEMFDFKTVFIGDNGKTIYFTEVSESSHSILMTIFGVTALRGADLDLDFINKLKVIYDFECDK